jgi:hypothetical protein
MFTAAEVELAKVTVNGMRRCFSTGLQVLTVALTIS